MSADGGWSRSQLAEQLRQLGLERDTDVLVHASLRTVGWITDGPGAVLGAVQDVVGPRATVVVPAQTPDNSTTSSLYRRRVEGLSPAGIAAYRYRALPFLAASTPSVGMGILAEHVRCHPEACRSGHPITSFAALGPRAGELTARHPMSCHLGDESPLGRLSALGAQVLLLGVGYDKATIFHLAEYRLGGPLRSYHSKVPRPGRPEGVWTEYRGIRLDDSDFGRLGERMAAENAWARSGPVGSSVSMCFPMIPAVDFAERWMREHRPPAAAPAGYEDPDLMSVGLPGACVA